MRVAVCHEVLQCVLVCCSVSRGVAVCFRLLQCVAVHCLVQLCPVAVLNGCVAEYHSVLQCVAVCCSVLQCVAVCCSVLQCIVLRNPCNNIAPTCRKVVFDRCAAVLN